MVAKKCNLFGPLRVRRVTRRGGSAPRQQGFGGGQSHSGNLRQGRPWPNTFRQKIFRLMNFRQAGPAPFGSMPFDSATGFF